MTEESNINYDTDNSNDGNNNNKSHARSGRKKDGPTSEELREALVNVIKIYPGIIQTEIYAQLKFKFEHRERSFVYALMKLKESGKIVRTLQEGKGGTGNTPSYRCYLSESYCCELLETKKINKEKYDWLMEHLKSIADRKELNKPSLADPSWKNTSNLTDDTSNSLKLPKLATNAIEKNSDIIAYIKVNPGQTRHQIGGEISGHTKDDLYNRLKKLYKYGFIKYVSSTADNNPTEKKSTRHRHYKVLLGPTYFIYMRSQQMPKEELTDLMVTHDVTEDNINSHLETLATSKTSEAVIEGNKQKDLKRKREKEEASNNNLPNNSVHELKKTKENNNEAKISAHVLDGFWNHNILTRAGKRKELEKKTEMDMKLENANFPKL